MSGRRVNRSAISRVVREVVTRILRGPIPSVRQLCADAPATVDQAIGRAVAKSVEGRFATMQEFAAALPPPRLTVPTGS